MKISEWKKLGEYASIEGHKVFYIDTAVNKEPLFFLHGYPTSSYDFYKVFPSLSRKYRVIMYDHLGFGLSDKPLNYSYSIIEQADVALLLCIQLGIRSAHMVAHDYGTSVATEIIARRNMGHDPVHLKSLTLCNGSVHIELAKLRFIQKLLRNKKLGPLVARLSSKRIFKMNMKKLWYDPSTLTDGELDLMWDLLERDNGKAVLPKITQYLRERELFWHRWVGALKANTLKSNILWGRDDPVAGENHARLLHSEMKHSRLKILENVGHYPMIEDSKRWADALLDLLK